MDSKEMRNWSDLILDKEEGDDFFFFGYRVNKAITQFDHEQVLMQHIGLKDKNGKKIFEGDIVSNGRDYAVITFEHGCFGASPTHLKNLHLPIWEFDVTCTLQVIGNIHENPELLMEVEE